MNLTKLKKIGLILVISFTLLLTGCGGVYVETKIVVDYINGEHIATSVKSIKHGDHRDVTVYNFVDKTVDIYTNNTHKMEVSVEFNTDAQYAHHVQSYKRIFTEQIIQRGCQKVYGCQAEKKKTDDLVSGFKQQIEALEASSSDMETQLKALTLKESQLTSELAQAQSAEQQNVQAIETLQTELGVASSQKQEVFNNLNQLKLLAEGVLKPQNEGEK
jgi:hypothetical protein